MSWTKFRNFMNTRWGFFTLCAFLFWAKTIFVYLVDFHLGVSGIYQYFVLLINPIATTLLIFSIALYIKRTLPAYLCLFLLYTANSVLLLISVIYYREFTDFMTINVIFGYSSVSQGLSTSSFSMVKPQDIAIIGDLIVVLILLLLKKIKLDERPIVRKQAVAMTSFSLFFLMLNITLGEIDRPQLLTRTFDRNYLVKYLGIDTFTVYDGLKTAKNNQARSNADSSDLNKVISYTQKNYAQPNPSMFGIAKNKNIIVIHLESFQQFLINYKVNGKEVTPNINKFYADQNTLSFDNFYNQVGQGKTSDAETMLENSLFGLPSGSVMTSYGTSNTFQAMPAILDQRGYSTAAFHGDVGSFWNRDNTYKSWGYNYFFSEDYYKNKTNYSVGYGLKDKIFLKQSIKYIEKLPQPFYAKVITVTNHYPYELDKQNQHIEKTKTGDNTVDGYVQTAKYLDEAFGQFVDYLKKSGLYDNSMIVVYGDHYGISNNHKKAISQLLNLDTVTSYDLAQFQKVPFMIHLNGLKGGINHTYGGEIDVMPTLLDVLGIENKDTIQLGNDLLSPNRNQTVAFRNGDFVSPGFSKIGSKVYNNKGEDVTEDLTQTQKEEVKKQTERTDEVLSLSDKIVTGDLLRFYTPENFKKVNRADFSYKYRDGMKLLNDSQSKKTSVLQEHDGKSTQNMFVTDAPELK